MPKNNAAPAPKFDHRAITNYDCKPIRELLAERDKLLAEFDELTSMRTRWQVEIDKLIREAKLSNPDRSMVETLSTRRLQVEMAVPRLEEIERLIAECDGAIGAEFEAGLRPAVERLCSAEAARVRAEIVSQLQPHFSSDSAAHYHSTQTPRWVNAAPRLVWHHSVHVPAVANVLRALARLDHFDKGGDLEKEAS